LFTGLKISLMGKFLAFKLRFDIDILVFWPLFPKIRQNFIIFSGHTDLGASTMAA
jgi:hypothetical protein